MGSPELRTLRPTLDYHQRGGLGDPLLQAFDWGAVAAAGAGEERDRPPVLRLAAEAVRAGAREMWAFARKDPRKPVYSAKVATALALITLLVFLREPSDIVSHSVWAILTVVVVFEYTIGATLSKGLNRGLGTLTAGGLALAVAESARRIDNLDIVFLIFITFVVAFGATLVKLHPKMKPYEYGLRVFLLTFCYVTVSGYSTGEFIGTAVSRFLLIAIGAALSLAINIGIHPIWAGEDLHHLVAKNFAGVAKSLEGCVDGYLTCMEYERVPSKILTYQASDDPLYSGYREAVEAQAQEETLLGFAIWEPPHGPYKKMKYPWVSYTKVGGALRHCSFAVMALHGCILSEIQAPPESRKVFSAELHTVGKEGAKVLRELGQRVKTMTRLASPNVLAEVHHAAEQLQRKIDQRSYILVSTDRWGEATPRQRGHGHGNAAEGDNKDNDPPSGPEHAVVVNIGADSVVASSSSSLARFDSSASASADGGGSGGAFRAQASWPARLPPFQQGGLPFDAVEARTYESASALSLATFASLLIEFVARLRNLVDAFEELSDKAGFKDPVEEPSSAAAATGIGAAAGLLLGRIPEFFRFKR